MDENARREAKASIAVVKYKQAKPGHSWRRLTRHVDEVHFVPHSLYQRARQPRSCLHGPEARVADLKSHNLRTGSHAVLFWVVWMVRRNDTRDMRAVRSGVYTDTQHVASITDSHRVVQIVEVAEFCAQAEI